MGAPPHLFQVGQRSGAGGRHNPPQPPPLPPLQCGAPHVPPQPEPTPPPPSQGTWSQVTPNAGSVPRGNPLHPPPAPSPSAHLEAMGGGGRGGLRCAAWGGRGGAQLTAPVPVPELQPRRLLRPNPGGGGRGGQGSPVQTQPREGLWGEGPTAVGGTDPPPPLSIVRTEQTRRGGSSTFIDTPKRPWVGGGLGDMGLCPPPPGSQGCRAAQPFLARTRPRGGGGVPRL